MTNLVVDVEEGGELVTSVGIEIGNDDSVETIAQKVSAELEIDLEEILESTNGELSSITSRESGNDKRIKIRRVCVELHFEAHEKQHKFASKSKWALVHRWGCRHFNIAQDACANLELREGSVDGPVLNESSQIGSFKGCKNVWLVKPGAEPNGR